MKILTVFAHLDDAEIWCGGTLAKHAQRGDSTFSVSFKDTEDGRQQESEKAQQIIGGKLQVLDEDIHENTKAAIKKLEAILKQEKPDIVISHWREDSHPDHRKVFDIVAQAIIWPWILNKAPRYFFSVDTYSSQGMSGAFNPDYIVDITGVWEKKLAMIKCFESQPTHIWEEMVRKQNAFYGERIETDYAEAFAQNPIQGKKIANDYLPIL